MKIFNPDIDTSKYIVATYYLGCLGTLSEGAYALAVGQSIGNPTIRSNWETDDLINQHACMIMHDKLELSRTGVSASTAEGIVKIGFPVANIDWETDGISQLLCQLMGGQMDIDSILKCRLIDIEFPKIIQQKILPPRYGIKGIRKHTDVDSSRPLLGGIIKPKVGLRSAQLLDMVKQMVDGGVNFIKEDEIMSNPAVCSLKERVPLINNWLIRNAPKVIYAVSITCDSYYMKDRVAMVHNMGANAIHFNVWGGLGSYKSVREMNLDLFLFYQKSGDKVITDSSHRFGIDWPVLCKLAVASGIDFIHAGMWGGYMNTGDEELTKVLQILREGNVMPSLSCGMTPDLIQPIVDKFGPEFMATVGGYIHGHPMGSRAGSAAMRQAIERGDTE